MTAEIERIRVMLVDDQDLIRHGFRLMLSAESDLEVVADVATGEAALELLAQGDAECDVVLMDVRMPGMGGIEATRQITAGQNAGHGRAPRVLVLTTFDGDQYVADAVQAGAAGFLLKDARPEELVDAIRRVHQGDAVMAPQVATRLWEQMRATPAADTVAANGGDVTAGGDAAAGGGAVDSVSAADGVRTAGAGNTAARASENTCVDLTDRERDVLALIGEGLNNAEIMDELFLSESTVKTHVRRVFQKLGVRDRVQAVIYAKDHRICRSDHTED